MQLVLRLAPSIINVVFASLGMDFLHQDMDLLSLLRHEEGETTTK
nr:hypothetical protein Q903MT_gene3590 [Picea sitchensis]